VTHYYTRENTNTNQSNNVHQQAALTLSKFQTAGVTDTDKKL